MLTDESDPLQTVWMTAGWTSVGEFNKSSAAFYLSKQALDAADPPTDKNITHIKAMLV